jgi:hypothetical protein
MKKILPSILMLLGLLLMACEIPLPSSDNNSEEQAGPGVWLCLNQETANNAVIKKFGFDYREMVCLPRCQQAVDVAVADNSGSIWTSSLDIDGYYRIYKYSDGGAEILHFEQQNAGFPFLAQSLAPDPNDGSCWFVTFALGQSHVCKIGPGGGLLVNNTEFVLPVEVSAVADGGCWVLDKSAMSVSRLDAEGRRIFSRSLEGHTPRSLAVDPISGACWVGYDNIIVKYASAGEELLENALENEIIRIAVHPNNHSICIQSGFDLVDAYDSAGNFNWRFYSGGTISDIQMTVNDGIWVADRELHSVYRISDSGNQEATFTLAFAPEALAVCENPE